MSVAAGLTHAYAMLHSMLNAKDRQRLWLERKHDIIKIGGGVALLIVFLVVISAAFASPAVTHAERAANLAASLQKADAAGGAGAGAGAGAGPPLDASVITPSALDDPDADASALAAVAAAAAKASDLEVEDDETSNDEAAPVVSPAVAAGLPEAQQTNPAMPALLSNPLPADSEMHDLLPLQPASAMSSLADLNKEKPSSEMPDVTKAMPVPAPVIQLTPVDPAAANPTPTALDANPFGAAARSRISRISRVVEPADLMRMKLNAGASDASAVSGPATSAASTVAGSVPAPSDEDAMDSLEQSALDRWGATNYTARMAKFPAGHVDQEGRWVAGAFPMLPRGWDAASMRNLVLVWDFGGGGCSGWGVEASNMVLSLAPYIGKIGIIAGKDTWCKGLPDAWIKQLEAMRTAPIAEWGSVDVWVSHKPPQRYPTFPYRGVVRVSAPPHFVIGRSMSEIHRIPRDWTQAIRTLVDEVWVPSHNSLDAFTKGGANPLGMRVIPEPIDPLLYDPLETQPLPASHLPPQRRFNWLSIFKLEERKGWKILVESWMREFSEKDDVTLNLHTYLFAESSESRRRSPKLIREVIEEFVGTLDFGARDMEARPLPWANLNILAQELDTTMMPRLYKSMQGFVLPTHGEGWGMPLMESMAMGLPTLATNWGGQLEFMHQGNSYLIPVDRFERADPQFFPASAKWATASGEALQRAMRHVVAHPDHAVPIGARARSGVLTKFNSQAVAARMLRRLQEIYPIILERRAAVLEGRKVVRGSHLLTSHSPVATAAAPLDEGLLARRGGDSLAEAKQADSAREARELDEAVALSIKTGWRQSPEEAAADAAELVAMAQAAVPALKAAAEAEQQEQQEQQNQEQDSDSEPQQANKEPLSASIATPRASAQPSDDQTSSMNDPFPQGGSLSAEISSPASQAAADGDSAKPVPLEAGIENDATDAVEVQADGDWRARMKARMEAEADAAVDAAADSSISTSPSPPFVAGSITPPANVHADPESVSPSVEVNSSRPNRSSSGQQSRKSHKARSTKNQKRHKNQKRRAAKKKSRADLQALKAKYAAAAAAAAAELDSLPVEGDGDDESSGEVSPIMDPKPKSTLDPRQQYEAYQQTQAAKKTAGAEVEYDEEPATRKQAPTAAAEAEEQPTEEAPQEEAEQPQLIKPQRSHSRSRRPQREEREE